MFGEFRDALLTTPGEMSSEARFDILISNAGFDGRTSLGATDASTMDALYRVHVKGSDSPDEMLTPYLRDGGRIVFLSTGLTRFVANPVYSVYAAMKDAIEVHTTYAANRSAAEQSRSTPLRPGRQRRISVAA